MGHQPGQNEILESVISVVAAHTFSKTLHDGKATPDDCEHGSPKEARLEGARSFQSLFSLERRSMVEISFWICMSDTRKFQLRYQDGRAVAVPNKLHSC